MEYCFGRSRKEKTGKTNVIATKKEPYKHGLKAGTRRKTKHKRGGSRLALGSSINTGGTCLSQRTKKKGVFWGKDDQKG